MLREMYTKTQQLSFTVALVLWEHHGATSFVWGRLQKRFAAAGLFPQITPQNAGETNEPSSRSADPAPPPPALNSKFSGCLGPDDTIKPRVFVELDEWPGLLWFRPACDSQAGAFCTSKV